MTEEEIIKYLFAAMAVLAVLLVSTVSYKLFRRKLHLPARGHPARGRYVVWAFLGGLALFLVMGIYEPYFRTGTLESSLSDVGGGACCMGGMGIIGLVLTVSLINWFADVVTRRKKQNGRVSEPPDSP